MESKKYCVFNKTTERFLSAGVTSLSTKNEPLEALKMMVDAEDLNVESGLWLTPFKGIPIARIFSPVDLVYLDKGYQVLHAVEQLPGVALTPFEGQAASALVLPLHTIYTSRTHPGDQLIICVAEELVRQLARVSTSVAPAPVTQRAESAAKKSRGAVASAPSGTSSRSGLKPGGSTPAPVYVRADPGLEMPQGRGGVAPSSPDARRVLKEVQSQPSGQKAPTELQAREIDSVISQVLRWAEEAERPLMPAPASTAHPPVPQKTEPSPESPSETAAVVQPPTPLKSEVEEEAETWTEQDATVLAQSVRWVEDTKPRLEPASIAAAAPAVPDDRSAAMPPTTQPLKVSETAEPKDEKKESLKIRLQRVAEQIEQPLRSVPASTAAASRSTESRSLQTPAEQGMTRGSAQAPAAVQKSEQKRKAEPRAKGKESLQNRFMRWLYAEPVHGPADRRKSSRYRAPGLIAYYYTGGAPKPHKIGDISATGFYLVTEERWLPETMIRMTLQRAGTEGENPEDAISVVSKIVRYGSDGVGSEFILSESTQPKSHQPMLGAEIDRETLERFLHSSNSAQ